MAKARIELTCAKCGKTYWREKICYNRREADEWEAWMASNPAANLCTECWRAEKIAEEHARLEHVTEGLALPELTGSEKQVKWAIDLRAKKIESIKDAIGAKPYCNAVISDYCANKTDAKWWIDNRWSDITTNTLTCFIVRHISADERAALREKLEALPVGTPGVEYILAAIERADSQAQAE